MRGHRERQNIQYSWVRDTENDDNTHIDDEIHQCEIGSGTHPGIRMMFKQLGGITINDPGPCVCVYVQVEYRLTMCYDIYTYTYMYVYINFI